MVVLSNPSPDLSGAGLRQGAHLKGHTGTGGILAAAWSLPFLSPSVFPPFEPVRDDVEKTEKGVA